MDRAASPHAGRGPSTGDVLGREANRSVIEVHVRDDGTALAKLGAAVPSVARWRPIWSGVWRALIAAVPGPLLLWAFDLPGAAAAWTGIGALLFLIWSAIEWEAPLGALGPVRVRLDEHGVTIEREQQIDRWTGAAIREVHALAEVIVVVSHRDGWLVVPRASFDSAETAERFVAIAQQLAETPKSWTWPRRESFQWGFMAFLLAVAAVLGWLAWDASLLRRAICGPIAGVAVVLALSEISSSSRRFGKAGRPTPPRPGTTDASGSAVEAYVAAARSEQLRPSWSLVIGVYVLAASLLYPTLLAGSFGTSVCVVLAAPLLAFAIYELAQVFELWQPWRPPRNWRQIEAGSVGIVRRHAGGSVTIPWSKLRAPVVETGAVKLVWADGTTFETVANSEFAQPEERDAFIAFARASAAG